MSVNQESVWITARDALAFVVEQAGDRLRAKGLIADYLKDGKVAARASMIWVSSNKTVGRSFARHPSIDPDDAMEVHPSSWRRSRTWLEDSAQWRWDDNFFCITTDTDPIQRLILHQVEFLKRDIESVLKTFGAKIGKGGNPGNLASRDSFWHAIVKIAQDGRLDILHFQTQAELAEEVMTETQTRSGPIYGEKTTKALVRQVWYKFVEPNVGS